MANMEIQLKIDTSDLEMISKVICKNTKCKNHLIWKKLAGCGLKNISISREGFCSNYTPKEAKE